MEAAWLAVRVEPSGDRQAVIDALFQSGSQGVQEEGSAIITHFPPGSDMPSIESAIRTADPAAQIEVSVAPRVDWTGWRASVTSHELGRITISPPWLAQQATGEIVVSIDPAMAFGTGEHATTRGVIRLMQRVVPMPEVVADLGAGSAVLAICAAKLGAKRVAAVELDPDAIGNAGQNIAANGVEAEVRLIEGDAARLVPLIAPVGLVVANIISSVLSGLLAQIHDSLAPGGRAILSGILVEERDMMVAAAGAAGFNVEAEDSEEGWWSVLLAPQ